MTNKTPQWEENIEQAKLRFWFLKYSSQDEFNADFEAFIKSTLEEVIERIHECCDGECYHDDCCGKLPCVKSQLRKEFL